MFESCVPALAAFAAAVLLTPTVRAVAFRIGAVDFPGKRKVHPEPVARLGGVALAAAILTGLAVSEALRLSGMGPAPLDPALARALALGGPIVFLVGLWDDIKHLPPGPKFLLQALAAALAMHSGILIERVSLFGSDSYDLGLWAWPVTFLWIVGITNAFNLIDGLDGLAAGLASIAAATSAGIFFLKGDVAAGVLLAILVGAAAGFLRYNFNPATIFLGDCGSLTLGYILAVTAVSGSQKQALALATLIPLLVFGLPIVDTLLSMLRRFVGSMELLGSYRAPFKARLHSFRRMFQGDQGHIHHKLLALGLSHRSAVLVLYLCALGLSALALISVLAQYRNSGLVLITAALAAFVGIRKLGYEEIRFLRAGSVLRWYDQLSFDRRFFTGLIDVLIIGAAYWLAVALKFDSLWPRGSIDWFVETFPLVLVVQMGLMIILGLEKGVWRALGIGDLVHNTLVVATAVLVSYSIALISEPPSGVAHSFFVIDFLLLAVFVLGSRSAYRVLHYLRRREQEGEDVLIYSAEEGGQAVLNQILRTNSIKLRPVGFIDDKWRLRNRTVDRFPVLGSREDLPNLLRGSNVKTLIVAKSDMSAESLRRLIQICEDWNVRAVRWTVEMVPLRIESFPRPINGRRDRSVVRAARAS